MSPKRVLRNLKENFVNVFCYMNFLKSDLRCFPSEEERGLLS